MGYVIRSKEHFIIGTTTGTTKSSDIGLNVEFLQPVPMAVQQYTEWQTGADMSGASPDNYFENIEYDITARVLRNPTAFASSEIYALFANARTMTLSNVPGYFYRIRKVLGIVPEAAPELKGNEIIYTISLELAPFKYHLSNAEQTVTGGTIENPGTRYSRPIYKIIGRAAGNTTTKLTVNGQQLTLSELTDASTTIYIDTERMLIYDQANTNLMPKSSGILPFLAPGVNTASVTAGTLSITGNWRSY